MKRSYRRETTYAEKKRVRVDKEASSLVWSCLAVGMLPKEIWNEMWKHLDFQTIQKSFTLLLNVKVGHNRFDIHQVCQGNWP